MAAAERELGDQLMPFELLTAAAFSLFARQAVDVAVLEVGVLGRFDATNVADGAVAVITNIGFDHTDGEGDWQWRIAEEKAGIVKPGAHVILGDVDERLLARSASRSRASCGGWAARSHSTATSRSRTAGRSPCPRRGRR